MYILFNWLLKRKLNKIYESAPNPYSFLSLSEDTYYDLKDEKIKYYGKSNLVYLYLGDYLAYLMDVSKEDILKWTKHTIDHNLKIAQVIEKQKELPYTELYEQCIDYKLPLEIFNGEWIDRVWYTDVNGLRVFYSVNYVDERPYVYNPTVKLAISKGLTGHDCQWTIQLLESELFYKEIYFSLYSFNKSQIRRTTNNFDNYVKPLIEEYLAKYYPGNYYIDYEYILNRFLSYNTQ